MTAKPTTSKHTPGPWDDASKYPEFASVRIFAKTHYIATVGNSDDTREQTAANARLIAAAPELLAALEKAMSLIAQHALSDLVQEARTAIAKATQPE